MEHFEKAYNEIKTLVEDFKAGQRHYLSKDYQEAEVRKDFIDKFLIALGWDVHHDRQKDPYEQEVKVERGVSMSGAQKRADYSFSLAPNFRDPKFFVEAKKPVQDLYNPDYYFQTIRYGWHKATPLAVLTDFEEFHILDCRFSPDISTILKRQVKRFHYSEYADKEKFAEIYWLFSREAVANNSLEKYAEGMPKPRGKAVQKALFALEKHQTIDVDFLNEIEEKREILAKALKRNDESLDSEQLTEATQKIIDRLVFIRFLEDKLIEQEHHVHAFGERGKAWDDFIALCRKLDAKYNGIVFKKNFIDSDTFKGPVDSEFHAICQDICHLNSRFLYNEIPIHILGSIYERFLGKVVHATGHRVKIEEKPEVRKAGGVYYTPKYIVDYIVQNTVGKLIEGKTPEQISKLRFADIACGSGSFLIGVFDCLLVYHNKYYRLHPDKAKKDGCHYKDGLWVLSIKQKQNMLRNNIYGVDIDAQAVEVTQLSLSLKMLEDETTATTNEMQVLFHEKILPDMTKNIVCGNSLIGTDILSQNLFAGDEERKLNPMDFEHAFPHIFRRGMAAVEKEKTKRKIKATADNKASEIVFVDEADNETNNEAEGFEQPHLKKNQDKLDQFHEPIVGYSNNNNSGFDAIVGNPPYLSYYGRESIGIDPTTESYLRNKYHFLSGFSSKTRINSVMFFLEKYIRLLNKKGLVGCIIDFNIFEHAFVPTRKFISTTTNIKQIVDGLQEFKGVGSGQVILTLSNDFSVSNKLIWKKGINDNGKLIEQKYFTENEDYKWEIKNSNSPIKKIEKDKNNLENVLEIITGVAVYATEEGRSNFILGKKENDKCYPLLEGGASIKSSYIVPTFKSYILYDKSLEKEFNNKFEKKYLKEKGSHQRPFNLRTIEDFNRPKIFLRQSDSKFTATYSEDLFFGNYSLFTLYDNDNSKDKLFFILGLLNSKMMSYYGLEKEIIKVKEGKTPQIRSGQRGPIGIRQLPIIKIDFQNKAEKSQHDKMVQLVDQMLQAKKQLQTIKTDKDKSYYERRCNELDAQIDNLVYGLYGLTEEEIGIVEKGS